MLCEQAKIGEYGALAEYLPEYFGKVQVDSQLKSNHNTGHK